MLFNTLLLLFIFPGMMEIEKLRWTFRGTWWKHHRYLFFFENISAQIGLCVLLANLTHIEVVLGEPHEMKDQYCKYLWKENLCPNVVI